MSWNELKSLAESAKKRPILDLFDETRAAEFSQTALGMLFDYSKTNIDAQTFQSLLNLAQNSDLLNQRQAMFTGAAINQTENRAVLHTALRNLGGAPIIVDGQDVMPDVLGTLAKMKDFAAAVRSGDIAASNGSPFSDVVNIGIGGSDLGPAMATLALAPYHDGPRTHFVSNVDGADIHDALSELDPATTLVIIASKTFTTIETMTNAKTARDWLRSKVGGENVGQHLAALSSANDKTGDWNIDPDRVFGFSDWVGGRYSVWGPIGLSLMIAIGPDNFSGFLGGAQAMDQHFQSAPLAENLPVLLALTGIWHNQICGYATRAVLPYDQRLARLPAYLQQLEMESNGKGVAMDGSALSQKSVPVIWGEPGTNGQHAFYQMIHQGTQIVPCEFMVARRGHEPDLVHQHRLLVANCLAQSEALMRGRSEAEALEMMHAKGLSGDEAIRQARHRVFPGNRPSITLVYDQLDPRTLGQIVAVYEHRVFVEGVILGINSFDQWGVELGKELAVALEPIVSGTQSAADKDGSTQMLVDYIQNGATE